MVAFRLDPKHNHHFDEFAVAHQLRERGWVVPAYTLAPNAGNIKVSTVQDLWLSKLTSLEVDESGRSRRLQQEPLRVSGSRYT